MSSCCQQTAESQIRKRAAQALGITHARECPSGQLASRNSPLESRSHVPLTGPSGHVALSKRSPHVESAQRAPTDAKIRERIDTHAVCGNRGHRAWTQTDWFGETWNTDLKGSFDTEAASNPRTMCSSCLGICSLRSLSSAARRSSRGQGRTWFAQTLSASCSELAAVCCITHHFK